MNISFIVDSVSGGGVYFRCHNLARALTILGHRVRVFGVDQNTRSNSREEVRDGVEYHITAAIRGQGVFGQEHHPVLALVRSFESRGSSDVVHAFSPLLINYVPWRRVALRKAGACWYDWCDLWADGGLYGARPRSGLRRLWAYECARYVEHHVPRHADGVSAISRYLATEACKRGARRTILLRNGMWPLTKIPKASVRDEFSLDQTATYLGFMGRTIVGAELEWCVAALSAARSTGHKVRLALCGMPYEYLQRLPSEMLDYIDYRGDLSESEANRFSMGLDVGLLPMEDNRFNASRVPIKLTCYLSSGTTVVVSEVGDCAELAREIPGAIGAGKGRKQWIDSVRLVVEHYARGGSLPVVGEATMSALSWQASAETLAGAYLAGAW